MGDSSLPAGDFALDGRIQLWVLLPISIATLAMALLRRSLSALGVEDLPSTLLKVRDSQTLGRSQNLRMAPGLISHAQFALRKHYFGHERSGLLAAPRAASGGTASALMSPQTLANQVTGLLSGLVPQMILGAWARYLFAGVAVCRLPFSLSGRFREMLQSGMEAAGQNVGVHYVSALSWYLLNLFGNAAVVFVLTYGSRQRAQPSVAAQIALSMNSAKVFENEKNALQQIQYVPSLDAIELKLLEN